MTIQLGEDGVLEIALYHTAEEGEMFAPDAAQKLLGQRMPVGYGDEYPEFMGTVTSAEVLDAGKSLKVVVKVDKKPSDPAEIARFLSGASKWAN